MFDIFFKKNSISKIAQIMPVALVGSYEKKEFYSCDEVRNTFFEKLKDNNNIEYAYAMFCSESAFEEDEKLNVKFNYSNLRLAVSKECFGSWPRFNFDSLLDYSQRSLIGGGDTFGGEGTCGDGGC